MQSTNKHLLSDFAEIIRDILSEVAFVEVALENSGVIRVIAIFRWKRCALCHRFDVTRSKQAN